MAVETVSYNGVQVASHNDMEDDKQTMNVAEIGSEAFINGSKEVSPNDVKVNSGGSCFAGTYGLNSNSFLLLF